jgi:hypothetical protein
MSGITEAEFLEIAREVRAEAVASALGQPTPATPPNDPPADDPHTAIRDAGAEAIAAERAHAETLHGARALLRARAKEQGYPMTTADTDAMSDTEVLTAVGFEDPNEDPRRKNERERVARENAIANDPAQLEAELRNRDLAQLDRRWFSLAVSERQAECKRLGIPYEAAEAEQQETMRRRFP